MRLRDVQSLFKVCFCCPCRNVRVVATKRVGHLFLKRVAWRTQHSGSRIMIIDRTLWLVLKSNSPFATVFFVLFCFVLFSLVRRVIFSITSSGQLSPPSFLAFVPTYCFAGWDIFCICILRRLLLYPAESNLPCVPPVMLDLVGVCVFGRYHSRQFTSARKTVKRPVYNLSFPRPRPQPYPTRMSVCCGGKSEDSK